LLGGAASPAALFEQAKFVPGSGGGRWSACGHGFAGSGVASQIFTVPSDDPLVRRLLSGLKTTLQTQFTRSLCCSVLSYRDWLDGLAVCQQWEDSWQGETGMTTTMAARAERVAALERQLSSLLQPK
jgi:hypothetical protein